MSDKVANIENLTPEQEAKMPEYRDKWLEIGMSTGPANRDLVYEWIDKVYEEGGHEPIKNKDKNIVFVDGPLAVYRQMRKWNINETPEFLYGAQEACWLSSYDYIYNVLGVEAKNQDIIDIVGRLIPLVEMSKGIGWWVAFDEAAIIADRPTCIHMRDGQLHCETGPAIDHKDGLRVYALNGRRVQDWIVETPADKLDPKKISELDNVEERREFISKVGIERLLDELKANTLDKSDGYELVRVRIDERNDLNRLYLKMINPSTGDIHMETVHPNCANVNEALAYRNHDLEFTDRGTKQWLTKGKGFIKPDVLT